MSKKDELDRSAAAAYAWRIFKPGDKPSDLSRDPEAAEADEESETREADPAELEKLRADAFQACSAIADGVDRAWQMEGAPQAAAVSSLLARASELSIGLCAMQHYPRQSIRLLRLAVRCRERLSPEAQEHAFAASMWLDYSHGELVDLLVEVALAGDEELAGVLSLPLNAQKRELARMPGAAERFARLLEQAPTPKARLFAMRWLEYAPDRAAIPALCRALRLPHFCARHHALALLNRHFPDAIEAQDLLFLLDDALVHPAPDLEHDEENHFARLYFPGELEKALLRLRPPAAREPLIALVDNRFVPSFYSLSVLDAGFALGALAALFPDEALPRIDHRQRRVEWDRRKLAVEAAGKLPDALAWPRLQRAATDAVPQIAERARQIWLERRGEILELEALVGVETALLENPPSEQMLSRLELLRRSSLEARAAMVEVLFNEAPDSEALALLVFAMVDSGLWQRRARPGLPTSRKDFCRQIIERFGVRGVEGICLLAERYPEGRWGFLSTLDDLLRSKKEKVIPEAAYPILKAFATRRMRSTSDAPDYSAISILGRVGAPPELFDALCAIAWDAEIASHMRTCAAGAIAALEEGNPPVAEVILKEMREALAVPDYPRFARAAAPGIRRKLPQAIEMTLDVVGRLELEPEGPWPIVKALASCMGDLESIGALPADWMQRALARQGTNVFVVAAMRAHREAMPETYSALREALSLDAPIAAAESAMTLIWHRELEATDPRLYRIAERAPLPVRSDLLWRMLYKGTKVRELWPLAREVLISEDPAATDHARSFVSFIADAGLFDELREIRPSIVDQELLERLDESLDVKGATESYWLDEQEAP